MIALSTSPVNLSMLRKLNTWYSIADGNWSNPNIWVSNAKRKYSIPQPGDNVYVNNSVTLDVNNLIVNNLLGDGYLIFGTSNSRTVVVNGCLNITGTVDMSNASHTLSLNGYDNYIFNFISGSSGTVTYNGSLGNYILNQPVMALSYCYLTIRTQNCWLTGDTTVNANLNVTNNGNIDLLSYNLTITGTTSLQGGNIARSVANSGALLKCIGQLNSNQDGNNINLGTTNNIELHGGIQTTNNIITAQTIAFSFSQTIAGTSSSRFLKMNGNMQIDSGVVLTVATDGVDVVLNGSLNGVDGTSTYSNYGVLSLLNNTTPMTTGIFTMQASASLEYLFNGNATIPYSSLNNLTIGGTGVKTLGSDLIINGFLKMQIGTLELSTFNLTVEGISNDFISSSSGLFGASTLQRTPTSTGALLKFVGQQLNCNNDSFILNIGSTNDIELQNGFGLTSNTLTFRDMILSTTQTITDNGSGHSCTLNGNMRIGNGCSVTLTTITVIIEGILDGNDLSSSFINKSFFNYQNSQQPMQTGLLFCNEGANTFVYGLSGAQDITVPSDGIPGYQNLTLNGTGIKRLLGNVSIKGTYTLTSPATLNSNGFVLTNP
jgi:hypothetical protein